MGRFTGRVGADVLDVSIYGRDASDAQLLAKTFRFLLYRDSGPTLALTRRQQVEHVALLTMTAQRVGARVPDVVAAGPVGPANDAVLVTTPPRGRLLSSFTPFPTKLAEDGADDGRRTADTGAAPPPRRTRRPARPGGRGRGDRRRGTRRHLHPGQRAPRRGDRPRFPLDRDHRGGRPCGGPHQFPDGGDTSHTGPARPGHRRRPRRGRHRRRADPHRRGGRPGPLERGRGGGAPLLAAGRARSGGHPDPAPEKSSSR